MPQYHSDLTTREAVEQQLEKANPNSSITTEFRLYVDSTIHSMSRYILEETGRSFVPYIQSLEVFANSDEWANAWRCRGDDYRFDLTKVHSADLLNVDSIVLDGTTLTSAMYRLLPTNTSPANQIALDSDTVTLPKDTDFNTSIVITGTYGYYHDFGQLYSEVETGITVTDATTTSITVADASLYETFEYIQLEDELLQILARDEDTEVLTVKRGVNGSTATSHASVALNRVNINQDIKIACTRLVAWAYNNRNDLGTQLSLPDGSVIRNEMPTFVRSTISNYKRYWMGTS